MAIARKSLTQATATAGGSTSVLTTSVTVVAGTDRILVVVVNLEGSSGGTIQVTSITFGGVALTRLIQDTHADWASTEIWYLKSPAVSTANIVTTVSANNNFKHGIYAFDGVDPTTTFRTAQLSQGSTGTSASVTVPSVVAGDYVIDGLTLDSTGHSGSVGANQTGEWNDAITGSDALSSTQAGVDGGVMSWTWTTNCPFALVATALIPSAGAINISHVVGTLVLNGGTQVVQFPGTVTQPAAGILNMTAVAPSLVATSVITEVAGILVLGSVAPAITTGGTVVTQPAAGILVLGATAPAINAGANLTHTAGILLLQGGTHTINTGAAPAVVFVSNNFLPIYFMVLKERFDVP